MSVGFQDPAFPVCLSLLGLPAVRCCSPQGSELSSVLSSFYTLSGILSQTWLQTPMTHESLPLAWLAQSWFIQLSDPTSATHSLLCLAIANSDSSSIVSSNALALASTSYLSSLFLTVPQPEQSLGHQDHTRFVRPHFPVPHLSDVLFFSLDLNSCSVITITSCQVLLTPSPLSHFLRLF